jgi:hypothetical protein
MGLDAGPELDRGAKISGQSQGGIRTDTALLVADFADPHGRHAYVIKKQKGHILIIKYFFATRAIRLLSLLFIIIGSAIFLCRIVTAAPEISPK